MGDDTDHRSNVLKLRITHVSPAIQLLHKMLVYQNFLWICPYLASELDGILLIIKCDRQLLKMWLQQISLFCELNEDEATARGNHLLQ